MILQRVFGGSTPPGFQKIVKCYGSLSFDLKGDAILKISPTKNGFIEQGKLELPQLLFKIAVIAQDGVLRGKAGFLSSQGPQDSRDTFRRFDRLANVNLNEECRSMGSQRKGHRFRCISARDT